MSTKYLIKNASITTFWRGLGIVSGALLDAVVLYHFGLGAETDALFASLAIPSLINSALDIQSPKILIPAFTRCSEEEGNEATSRLVSALMTTFAAILGGLALLLSLFAHLLIRVQAPGFTAGAVHVGVVLFLMLVWLNFVQGISTVLQSFLYSRHRYVVPGMSKIMTTLPAIVVIMLYHAKLGIYSVALGMLCGPALQLLQLALAARKNGYIWSFRWNPRDPEVVEIIKNFGHPLLGHVLSESKIFVENFLASMLGGGSLSVLRYASRIVEAISGVLLGGIVTSSLPLISVYTAEKKLGEMKKSVLDAIRLITFLALPISGWLIFVGQPMIVLLYERGLFTREDATHTAIIMALLTPYVIFGRLIGITQTPFYAKLDTKTPLVSVILFFGLYTSSVIVLSKTIGLYGFPIASSFASIATAVAMSALLHRAFGPLGWKLLKKFGSQMAVVMALTICAFVIGHTIGRQFLSESFGDKLIRFAIPTALGFSVFLAGSVAFRLLGRKHLAALVSR